jgi:hypothetical protein
VHRGTLIASPFVMICATSSSQDQLKCAELFAAERYPTAAAHEERKVNGARDNVAYVSADFGEHAVSLLTAGLFENHDRSQFRTIGISLGRDDRGKMRDRIKSSFETFIDAGERSDSEVATLMPGSIGGIQGQPAGGGVQMPAKTTRSVPSAAVRAARRAGSHPHLASVLREGRKNASIHASSGVIRIIAV